MKIYALLFLTVCAGCVQSEPSPTIMKMADMCQAGNTQACAEVAAYERQEQDRYAASVKAMQDNLSGNRQNPADFTTSTGTTIVICDPRRFYCN